MLEALQECPLPAHPLSAQQPCYTNLIYKCAAYLFANHFGFAAGILISPLSPPFLIA